MTTTGLTARPTLRENLRSFSPTVWILFGGTFINRFGTFVMPFLTLYLTRSGWSVRDAGLALSAYGGGNLCASIVGGHLTDRIGRRNTIALAMFGSATMMLALSQARGFAQIVVVAALAGLAGEFYRPASHALIADLVPPERRVTAFGVYRFAVNLGFACGTATAGLLADHSFLYLFAGDAATSAIYGCIALAFLPAGLVGTATAAAPGGFRHALRNRAFVVFLAASVLITCVVFQVTSTFPLHVRSVGLSDSTYGLLIALNGLLIVLFELGITAWTQHRPVQPTISTGYLLWGIGFGLIGFAHSVPALAATVVLWSMGEMISSPLTGAYIASIAPPEYRGRYMGLWVLTFSTGMLVGPAVGTLVYAWKPGVLWASCAVLGVASAALARVKVSSPAAK